MEPILLASGSARRQELLTRARIPFKAFPPNLDEASFPADSVEERVRRIAAAKIEKVVTLFRQESPRWVLGVDTLVEIEGRAISKSASLEEAASTLRLLSGKVHRVFTGIGFLPNRGEPMDLRSVCTEVKFIELSEEEIEAYLLTGEWSAVTGAYRIQEQGSFFVEWIRGSHSNVVGLPLETFYDMLKKNRYPL